MTDWAATGRKDEFSAVLVDPFTLEEVAPVEVDWADSSVTFDWEGDHVAGASIKLLDGADYRIGQKQHMVRVKDVVTLPDGTSRQMTLGTFFCEFSAGTSLYGREDRSLDCYSCLYRHSRDVLRDDFFRPGDGTSKVVDAIRSIVEADGGRLALDPSANTWKCFGTDIWFEAGANKLDVLREMAGWVGCELLPDDDGRVLMRASVGTLERDPVYTFDAGAGCVYKAGIDWGTDRADLVNRVIYVYTDGDQTQTAVSDLPAWAQMSYENVGYHMTRREVVAELPEGGLQAACDADLEESSVESNDATFEAVLVPGVRVGDTVRYVNPDDYTEPLDVIGRVVQMDTPSLAPGALTTYKGRIARWH